MKKFLLFFAACCLWIDAQSQKSDGSVRIFNHGRTRSYGGGLSFSNDGKTIYLAHAYQPDSASVQVIRLAETTFGKNGWSAPVFLNPTSGYNEISPVLSADQKRLYFSSNAPAPGKNEASNFNIWYIDKLPRGWSKPVFVDGLNTDKNERPAFIDAQGNLYFSSDVSGNFDLYVSTFNHSQWQPATAISVWNSEDQEQHVSVYSDLSIALLHRVRSGVSSEILISKLVNDVWTAPMPLQYQFKSAHPYFHRFPVLSTDRSQLYITCQNFVWQWNFKKVLSENGFQEIAAKIKNRKAIREPAMLANEPEVFEGLVLNTSNGISFTPDQKTLYISRYTLDKDSTGRPFVKIFESTLSETGWSIPKPVSFNKPGVPFEYHPVISSDGTRLFYNSRAPRPGDRAKYYSKNNLWYVDKLPDGNWGEPVMIEAVATDSYDDYASVARNGNLYFRSDRPGGKGGGDIYMSKFTDGHYEAPVILEALNSADNENDVCIDPQERFIIFNRYFDQNRQIKLYISFNSTNGWTTPRLLNTIEKSFDWELTPTLSPDGKYFFYEVNSTIMRIALDAILLPSEKQLLSEKG